MHLESYTCELYLLQREESMRHLSFKCAFARNCWNQIVVAVPIWLKPEWATRHIKRLLPVSFAHGDYHSHELVYLEGKKLLD
jgi:hypothetical protein